jgi:hypothetical protein
VKDLVKRHEGATSTHTQFTEAIYRILGENEYYITQKMYNNDLYVNKILRDLYGTKSAGTRQFHIYVL